jgi:hypothetical protein
MATSSESRWMIRIFRCHTTRCYPREFDSLLLADLIFLHLESSAFALPLFLGQQPTNLNGELIQ